MSDALKPCPFCGSTRLSDECTSAAEISGHTYQTGWIECLDCGCDGPSVDLTDETPAQNDYQLVRDAWNRRAALAQPAPAPLTDEQIDQITAEQWGSGLGAPYAAYRAYARAIEAAHGITLDATP